MTYLGTSRTRSSISRMSFLAAAFFFGLPFLANAEPSTLYPGAVADVDMAGEWKELSGIIGQATANFDSRFYTSEERFEDISEYYSKIGKIVKEASESIPKLPNGMMVLRHVYILDGAENIETSHQWVTIQFPRMSMRVVPLLQLKQKLPDGAVRKQTSIVLTTRAGDSKMPKELR